jgi:hypothetical protein
MNCGWRLIVQSSWELKIRIWIFCDFCKMWHIALYETHAIWVSKPTRTGVYLYCFVHQHKNIVGIQGSVISKRPPVLLIVFIIPRTVVLQKQNTLTYLFKPQRRYNRWMEVKTNSRLFLLFFPRFDCLCIKKNWRLTATYGAFMFL